MAEAEDTAPFAGLHAESPAGKCPTPGLRPEIDCQDPAAGDSGRERLRPSTAIPAIRSPRWLTSPLMPMALRSS